MKIDIDRFTISNIATYLEVLKKIDYNTKGFVIILNNEKKVDGLLTDGDVRRLLINGRKLMDKITNDYKDTFIKLTLSNNLSDAIPLFKSGAINVLPIIDNEGYLHNIITKKQIHSLLLQDIQADMSYDFMKLDESLIEHEIYERPWGFYKTTVMNEYFQSKVICIYPNASLSLQEHHHREEHWIVAHGEGIVQLGESIISVRAGCSLFIPKSCKHRLTNISSSESLIITEVQLGDYFGEDDIIRYEDAYGRNCITSES